MAKGYTTEALVEAESLTTIDANTKPTTTEVAQWILEAEERIDEWTNTSFTDVSVTNEISPFDTHTAFFGSSVQTRGSLRADSGWGTSYDVAFLTLNGRPIRPIQTLTSLEVNQSSETQADSWKALTEQTGSGGDFILDYQTGMVRFLTDRPFFPTTRGFRWSGSYGMDGPTSGIPYKIQELATKLVAKRVIEAKIKRAAVKSPNSVTMESIAVQVQASQMVTLLKHLNEDIKELRSELINAYSVRLVK